MYIVLLDIIVYQMALYIILTVHVVHTYNLIFFRNTILLSLSICRQVGLPTADLDVELNQYVDLICGKL